MTQKIITITREYGSGGRLIAKKVAEALNIAFSRYTAATVRMQATCANASDTAS